MIVPSKKTLRSESRVTQVDDDDDDRGAFVEICCSAVAAAASV